MVRAGALVTGCAVGVAGFGVGLGVSFGTGVSVGVGAFDVLAAISTSLANTPDKTTNPKSEETFIIVQP